MDRSGIRSPAQTREAKDLFRKELVRQAGLGKMWAGDLEMRFPWSPGNRHKNWKAGCTIEDLGDKLRT